MALNCTITSLLSMVEDADELITENLSIFLLSSCNSSNTEIMLKIEVHLRHALSELSKVMNQWKTINRLPYELLVRIFDFVGRGVPMVQIARVCRHWRQLTLRTPSLWSVYRFPDDEKWAGILWHRSQRFPLDVKAVTSWGTRPPEISARWIPLHLLCGKLRSLSLVADLDSMKYKKHMVHIRRMFSSPAPRLARLSLAGLSWFVQRTEQDFSWIFDGVMPNLKSLTLHQISEATQYIRPGLQSLILSDVYVGDLSSFLHTLAGLPNLEILSLGTVSFSLPRTHVDDDMDSEDEFNEAEHRIVLTRLRTLHIKDDLGGSMLFDQCLSTSPDCFRCYAIEVFRRSALPVDSRVDQPNLALKDCSSLILGLDDHSSTAIAMASNGMTHMDYRSKYSPSDPDIVGLTADGLLLGPVLWKLARLTNLIVTAKCSGSIQGWTIFFDQTPHLDYLRIQPTGHACGDLILAALSPLDPHTTTPCRAPDLKVISIENNLADAESPTAIAMFQLLENRFASGRPIRKLYFQSSASKLTDRRITAKIQPFVGDIELFEGGLMAEFKVPEQLVQLSEQLIDENDEQYYCRPPSFKNYRLF